MARCSVSRSVDTPLSAMALSADGTQAVLGTTEGTAQLWRTADAVRLRTIQICNSKVTALAFHDDGLAFSSVGGDNFWRVWTLDGRISNLPFRRELVRSPSWEAVRRASCTPTPRGDRSP